MNQVWEPLEEEFYQYDPEKGLWTIVSPDSIKWQFGLDLKRAADEVGLQTFLWKRNDAKLGSFVNTLRGVVEKRDAFKKRSPYIHFSNGMLDLQSEPPRLMTFHPDYYSRNICPIAFDPEAECPRFINELLRSALDEDDISLLQRWAGSVLLGYPRDQNPQSELFRFRSHLVPRVVGNADRNAKRCHGLSTIAQNWTDSLTPRRIR